MIEAPIGKRLKIIALADPDQRVVVMRRPDGLYFFVKERFWRVDEDDEFWGPHAGWQPESASGLFGSAQLAEDEVRCLGS